jgi:hypothetical protein
LGVVASFAPYGEDQLASGAKVLSVPVYLMERFESWFFHEWD